MGIKEPLYVSPLAKFVTPAKAGVQNMAHLPEITGFRRPPE
jgi:hypothetical protein